jgi:flagellar motor switch protein FliG
VTSNANLRKAAILIRSLDADSAASVLARLAPAEAKAVRLAIQSLGEVDPDERADVSAEFRRSGTVAQEDPRRGVELDLSSSASSVAQSSLAFSRSPIFDSRTPARPFEFLEQARVESLVPYLAREHAQTVAVVLSYLAPARAAQVLVALPEKLQTEAIERLSMLGDTDPNSLQVLECELADWVARQQATRTRPTQRTDTVAAILAAADPIARREILANLVKHNQRLAEQVVPAPPVEQPAPVAIETLLPAPSEPPVARPIPVATPRRPAIHFDDLTQLDQPTLTAVLKTVDAEVLVLALVGAGEALVARITAQMPGKLAKAFRQRLHACGPTRLRDVETAQLEVATVAAQVLHARHHAVLA